MNSNRIDHLSQSRFTIATPGRGLTEITARIGEALQACPMQTGLAQVFVHHTSCSLLIGENADPAVCADLDRFFTRRVPDGDPLFEHTAGGPDDMPAHVRSVLTASSLSIPVTDGRLALGTWQGVFLYEHRTRPHQRHITLTLLGSTV